MTKPSVDEITYSPDHILFPVPTKTDMLLLLDTGGDEYVASCT